MASGFDVQAEAQTGLSILESVASLRLRRIGELVREIELLRKERAEAVAACRPDRHLAQDAWSMEIDRLAVRLSRIDETIAALDRRRDALLAAKVSEPSRAATKGHEAYPAGYV